jgi:hypothetical protein
MAEMEMKDEYVVCEELTAVKIRNDLTFAKA